MCHIDPVSNQANPSVSSRETFFPVVRADSALSKEKHSCRHPMILLLPCFRGRHRRRCRRHRYRRRRYSRRRCP